MARKLVGWVVVLMGVGLLIAGLAAFTMARDGQDQVRSMLAAENIKFTDDAKEIVGRTPGEKVDTGEEAFDFAKIIDTHAMEATEGKRYADMEREDPKRQVAQSAASLRSMLMSAYGAEKEAQLGMFTGGAVALTGLALVGLAFVRREE